MSAAVPPACAWTEWGGAGDTLHFAHGNGFPPPTYAEMLGPLARRFRVVSLAARPLWPGSDPDALDGWHDLADDLVEELGRRGLEGVVGVGHSFGGVITLLAAARSPDLFRAVVVIDPVLLTGSRAAMWGWMRRLGLSSRLPIVRGALARRHRWPDRPTARRAWERRAVFSGWKPEVLDHYVRSVLTDDPAGGLRLAYPRRWEARIFATTPHRPWPDLAGVRTPVLAVRGGESDTFTPAAARRLQRLLPDCRPATLPGAGHCAPMEQPERVADLIRSFASGQ